MKIRNFKYNYFVLGTVAVTTFALVGCATGPYVSADVPRPGMSTSDVRSILTGESDAFEPGSSNLKTTSISFGAAAQYGRFIQDAYKKALDDRSQLRRTSNLSTIWLGISALGMEATDNGGDTALISGLVASALGISSRSLLTRNHEAAYSLGARQIACVLTSATNRRPPSYKDVVARTELIHLKDAVARYEVLRAEAVRKSNFDAPSFSSSYKRELIGIDLDIKEIEGDIQRIKGAGSSAAPAPAVAPPAVVPRVVTPVKTPMGPTILEKKEDELEAKKERKRVIQGNISQLEAELQELQTDAERESDKADRMIATSEAFLTDYNRLGEQLLNKLEEIRWEVNDAVRRSEPDLIQLNSNLRSVVSNQLGFSNQSLTEAPVPDVQGGNLSDELNKLFTINGGLNITNFDLPLSSEEKQRFGNFDGYWSEANSEGKKIARMVEDLRVAIKALSGKPILTFPDDTFSACSDGGLQSITAPAPVSLNPDNITLPTGYAGGDVLTAISGGTAPYGSPSKPNVKVSFVNNIASISVKGDAADAGKSPIQIIISDMFGKSAILTITPATAPEAQTTGQVSDQVLTPAEEAKKAKVEEIQGKILALKFDENATWLENLATTPGFSDITVEQTEGNGFVDGGFGKVTRQVVQHYVFENWDPRIKAIFSNPAPVNLQTPCAEAVKNLPKLTPDMDITGGKILYSDDELASTNPVEIDSAVIEFVLKCDIIK